MRPNWQVDLKWLAGLACLVCILLASTAYSFSKLTEEEPATGIFTGIVATFAMEGSEPEDFAEIQAQAAANPDDDFTIGDITLPVAGREIASLSYEEAVDLVVGRIAETLYADGPAAVEQYFADSVENDSGDEFSLGPFGLLTRNTHDTVSPFLIAFTVGALLLSAFLVYVSLRFGRLGSPGAVLAAGTGPFALLWFAIKEGTKDTDGEGVGSALAQALSPTAGEAAGDFLRLFILGLVLIFAATIGHLGWAVWERLQRSHNLDPA
ncbi:MAG: hypothetical protein V3S00_01475 [Dehalococcoidia bacterium]